MKYLDEDIELTFDGLNVTKSQTYSYVVYDEEDEPIFVGNMFLSQGVISKVLPITDICKNQLDIALPDLTYTESIGTEYVKRFYATVQIGNTTYDSDTLTVFMAYRYPNYKQEMQSHLDNLPEENGSAVLLQGNGEKLVPHYPYMLTNNYAVRVANIVSNDLDDSDFGIATSGNLISGTQHTPFTFNMGGDTDETTITLNDLFNHSEQTEDTKRIYSQDFENINATNDLTEQTITPDEDGFYKVDATQQGYNAVMIQLFSVNEDDTEKLLDYVNVMSSTTIAIQKTFDVNGVKLGTKHLRLKMVRIDGTNVPMMTINIQDGNINNTTIRLSIFYKKADKVYYLDARILFVYPTSDKGEVVLQQINGDNTHLIGEVDICPSRYYVCWRDRLGSYQSQAFEKTSEFSEDLDKSEFRTYKNEYRLAGLNIKPQWKLNSGWIDEKLYPYYESLFVSPYIFLFDTKEDKLYRVYAEDKQFTEKTFKNQGRQLFNLAITLKEDKTQDIIY